MYPTQSLAVVKIQMGKTEHFLGRGAFPASQNCLGQNVWVEKYPPPLSPLPIANSRADSCPADDAKGRKVLDP